MKLYLPILSILLTLLVVPEILAQNNFTQIGARAAGLGYAGCTIKDEWAIFNNPGGLADVHEKRIAFTHDFRPLFTSASRTAALFTMPLKELGVAGFSMFRFGDELYNEQIISTAFSNQFGLASLGLKVNYIQLHVEGFGRKGLLGIDFGGIAAFNSWLSIGAVVQNINQMKISDLDNEYMPTIMRAGVQLKATEDFLTLIEIEKDISRPSSYKAGFEYQFQHKFFIRSGFNLYPSAIFGGIGTDLRRIKIDYSISNNYYLGSAHQASACFSFANKK